MLVPKQKNIFLRHKSLSICVVIGAFAFLCVIIAIPIILKVTEHPRFCTICHNMKASVESFERSSHKGIECFKCHYEPGLVGFIKGEAGIPREVIRSATGKYDMEELEVKIKPESCLREGCHNAKRLEEKRLFYSGMLFSHKSHLEGLGCSDCHKRNKEIHMEVDKKACFMCHKVSEEKESCLICHKELKDTEEIIHKEVMEESPCIQCHEGIHAK
ncbi:MAG: NapC/NirT family cytochrome c [bacterium]|nr:NapC/NirT family cytochrome c [bacterium]